MIHERYFHAAVLAGLRAAWSQAGGALFLPDATDEALAAELRELLAPALQPCWIADRGRYARADAMVLADLLAPLLQLAEAVSGEDLTLHSAEWLRFRPGDYSLVKGSRGAAEDAIEATLDLSATPCEPASFVYLKPSGQRAFEQRPLALALIDRRPGGLRYDRYLPLCAGPAEVWRLRAALLPIA